jgi:hypothetical protein
MVIALLACAAMVIALLALFFSLTGSGLAAAVVAKARFALNAGKLQGKTRAGGGYAKPRGERAWPGWSRRA